eukprot:jgi/Hompol1/3410/HPOL_003228-RA
MIAMRAKTAVILSSLLLGQAQGLTVTLWSDASCKQTTIDSRTYNSNTCNAATEACFFEGITDNNSPECQFLISALNIASVGITELANNSASAIFYPPTCANCVGSCKDQSVHNVQCNSCVQNPSSGGKVGAAFIKCGTSTSSGGVAGGVTTGGSTKNAASTKLNGNYFERAVAAVALALAVLF